MAKRICSVDECDRQAIGQGFCKLHYNRWTRYGRTDRLRHSNPAADCAVEGCAKTHHAGGYCQTHYARVRRTGEAGPAEIIHQRHRTSKYHGATCQVEGCERRPVGRGWCRMHYLRWHQTGDAVGKWGADPRKSEGYLDSSGYFVVRVDGRKILEHRYVMEQILGRPLRDFENVHHKNGHRADNRPENLELWVKPQPQGQRIEDLVAWVVEMYPDEIRQALQD